MTLSFHPCIVSYQNIPWSYKNDVKLCGCTIELRRNGIAQYQPYVLMKGGTTSMNNGSKQTLITNILSLSCQSRSFKI